MGWGNMPLKIKIEFIEEPNEAERIQKLANILVNGAFMYLKNEGLLRVDPQRKEKNREASNNARKIINQDIPDSIGSA